MEDLIPFLIFLVIVAINIIKFFAEKSRPKTPAKTPAKTPGEAPANPPLSSLEKFFESLAEQVAPKPTELPDWPEDIERPDYLQEMSGSDHADKSDEKQTAEIIPMPKPAPATMERDFQRLETPARVQPSMQATNAILSGSQGMRMPCMNPFNHNTTAGHPDFRITGKKNLKQALLAHIVFSPPRANDLSFDNTIAK